MKFSQKTLKILKNFNTINSSIYFREGNVISVLATHKSIFARATVEEYIPKDFAIYDTSKLLASLSLFDDPDIECDEHWLNITSGRNSIRYVYCNPISIAAMPTDRKMELPTPQIQLTLDQDIFTGCMKAMGVLDVHNFLITGKNGVLSVMCVNVDDPTGNVYSVDIGKTEKEFEVIFNSVYLNLIPNTYEVGIVVPTKKDQAGISLWKSDDVEYFVAIETKSWIK